MCLLYVYVLGVWFFIPPSFLASTHSQDTMASNQSNPLPDSSSPTNHALPDHSNPHDHILRPVSEDQATPPPLAHQSQAAPHAVPLISDVCCFAFILASVCVFILLWLVDGFTICSGWLSGVLPELRPHSYVRRLNAYCTLFLMVLMKLLCSYSMV